MEKKVLKKLSLNKEEIVDLNKAEMGQLRGGAEGWTITTITVTAVTVTGDSGPTVPPTPPFIIPEPPTPEPYIPSEVVGADNCLSEVIVTPSPTPAMTM